MRGRYFGRYFHYQCFASSYKSLSASELPKGLDWLMKKADAFYHIALYDLDHFLLELVNLFPLAERPIPTVAMASMTLQREIFLYERSVVCDYHGTIECTDCAPAIAQRQAFTICDFGCQARRPAGALPAPSRPPFSTAEKCKTCLSFKGQRSRLVESFNIFTGCRCQASCRFCYLFSYEFLLHARGGDHGS